MSTTAVQKQLLLQATACSQKDALEPLQRLQKLLHFIFQELQYFRLYCVLEVPSVFKPAVTMWWAGDTSSKWP
jgi:hypothetical protein